eukprot:PITA_30144
MEEEIKAIEKNDTWELMNLLQGKEDIGVKWVYKTKSNAEGNIERHKVRLVVKGYKKQHGRDYADTLARVTRMDTMHMVVSIVAQHKLKVYQMDVKSTFLNGVLKGEVYVAQPLVYENNKPTPTPSVMGLKLSKEYCNNNVNSTLYKSMVGNLMYLTATRPDIMYATSLVARFMETPREMHWQATKRILRYVNGTKEYGILHIKENDFRLVGYTDSNWFG